MIDRCCMCKRNGDFVDHLLLHCDVTSAILSVFFNRFRMSWVILRCVVDLYDCWGSSSKPKSTAV
jgi:hypothetical protein